MNEASACKKQAKNSQIFGRFIRAIRRRRNLLRRNVVPLERRYRIERIAIDARKRVGNESIKLALAPLHVEDAANDAAYNEEAAAEDEEEGNEETSDRFLRFRRLCRGLAARPRISAWCRSRGRWCWCARGGGRWRKGGCERG